MRRTLIIGDIHGCIDELQALLRACDWTPADRLILAGDLVAKGPDSLAVVRCAMELGAEAVLGNHDMHVLRWYRADAQERERIFARLKPEHRKVVEGLTGPDWRWLTGHPLYLRIPEHRTVVVHAGLVPGRPLEAQRESDLISMRSLTEDGEASPRIEGLVPWASRWTGPELVVFGHDAVRGLQQHPHALGLDTGCVYGKALTALWLPERRLVSVPARRVYSPPGE
jgi:hypothetical protein